MIRRGCTGIISRFERLPNDEQGYSEYRHRQTGVIFASSPLGPCAVFSTTVDAYWIALFAGWRRCYL